MRTVTLNKSKLHRTGPNMEYNSKPVCRLCLQYCSDNFQAILEIATLMSLQLNINLAISDEPVMCESCSKALKKCYNFRTMCLNTEDRLSTITRNQNSLIDGLNEVYIKREVTESCDDVPEGKDECRFCLEPTKCALHLKDMSMLETKLENHFPELDLHLTLDPVVCLPCYETLESCFYFLSTCCDTERMISEYCGDNGTNNKGQIDLNEVCNFTLKNVMKDSDGCYSPVVIKGEDSEQDGNDVKFEVKTERSEVDEEYCGSEEYHMERVKIENSSVWAPQSPRKPGDPLKCPICAYETKRRYDYRRHMLKHKDASEIAMHQCDVCPYRAKLKSHLHRHQLTHKPDGEVPVYCCDSCGFQTRRKDSLNQHMQRHRLPPKEPPVKYTGKYLCEVCAYETKNKQCLQKHRLVHRSDDEVQIFRCDECDYKTRRKNNHRRHMLTHNTVSEVYKYECAPCAFKTKYKHNLNRHLARHK